MKASKSGQGSLKKDWSEPPIYFGSTDYPTTQAAPVGFANVQTFSRLDTTTVKLGDTGLGKGLDNLASKAKQVENTRPR